MCTLLTVFIPIIIVWLKNSGSQVRPPTAPLAVLEPNNPSFAEVQPLGFIQAIQTGLVEADQILVFNQGRSFVARGTAALAVISNTNLIPTLILPAGRVSKLSDDQFLLFTTGGDCVLGLLTERVLTTEVLAIKIDGFANAVGWTAADQTLVATFVPDVEQKQGHRLVVLDREGAPQERGTNSLISIGITRIVSGGSKLVPVVLVDFLRNVLLIVSPTKIESIGPPAADIGFIAHAQLFTNSDFIFAAYTGGLATFSTRTMHPVDFCFLPFFAEIVYADIDEKSGVFVATTNINTVLIGQIKQTGVFEKSRLFFLRLPEANGPCAVMEFTTAQQICSFCCVNTRGLVTTTRVAMRSSREV